MHLGAVHFEAHLHQGEFGGGARDRGPQSLGLGASYGGKHGA